MTDIAALSLRSGSAIGRALAAGEASPVALTEYLLTKIETNASANIFLQVTRERALEEAKASEKRLAAGQALSALDGVPIAWKDLIDLEGERTTAGAEVYRYTKPAEEDAPIAAYIAAAGMVSLGKVTMNEFAFSGLGLNPHFGTPHNPHSPDVPRIPGGSSSGCGVAIAAGLSPCAIGTDTGGSVRIPASFNGIVGFKPSDGRYSKQGIFPLSTTFDTPGPMARSVEDCVNLDMALRGALTTLVRRHGVEGLSFIVPETIVLDDLDAAVAANFEESLRVLEAEGAVIIRRPFQMFADIVQLGKDYGSIPAAEAYVEHMDLVDGPRVSELDQRVVSRILGGKKMSAADLVILHRERTRLIDVFKEEVGDALMLMPTTAMTAPELSPLETDVEAFGRANIKALRNTSLGNFLDLPGLALPNGFDQNRMPTSLMICAQQGQDVRLLSHGLEIERLLTAKST